MSILLLSLNSIERQIAFGLSQDATVIYYQHLLNAFDYLIEEDHDKANQEWRKFKHELGTGKIVSVTAGEDLHFRGRNLYVMNVNFRDLRCEAHFLLRHRGSPSDAEITPYLFPNKSVRDQAVAIINRT